MVLSARSTTSRRTMSSRIQIVTCEGINQGFRTQIRTWTNEVLAKAQPLSDICVTIWATTEELKGFYQKERSELGITTGEETDFLATHEAWRGYPRIHICQERLREVPDDVIRGAIHHEIGHALLHCTPEFYTFRYSNSLQEAARSSGLELALLQQCVYLLSIAIKDREVVELAAEMGLGFSQLSLLEYLISDVEEERRTWDVIRNSPVLSKIALAVFLKILLPLESLISLGIEGALVLKNKWNEAYGWLAEKEREALFRLLQGTLHLKGETFQERLEDATFQLIAM